MEDKLFDSIVHDKEIQARLKGKLLQIIDKMEIDMVTLNAKLNAKLQEVMVEYFDSNDEYYDELVDKVRDYLRDNLTLVPKKEA